MLVAMHRRLGTCFIHDMQDTCYHCPFAHPGLCEALDINEYYSVCYENNSFQFSPLSPPEERPEEGASEWDIITGPRFDGTESTLTAIVFCKPPALDQI